MDAFAQRALGKGARVVGDYACVLNQTNLGANNNKFYILQAVQDAGGAYYVFTRWGRVGLDGKYACTKPFTSRTVACTLFEGVFLKKTGNAWHARATFVPRAKKYDLVDVLTRATRKRRSSSSSSSSATVSAVGTQLDTPTFDLVRWILDADMFKHAMKTYNVDVKKCPLGAITKKQVAKGFQVLEQLDDELQKRAPRQSVLDHLSSRFYTVIPHACGMRAPPVIDNATLLEDKFDLVAMLGDIEIAQQLQQHTTGKHHTTRMHPVDRKYAQLGATLTPVARASNAYRVVQQFFNATKRGSNSRVASHPSLLGKWFGTSRAAGPVSATNTRGGVQLLQLWAVERKGEAQRFRKYDHLDNRRLLWHGTNVAVAAAILKTGLRIMPTASSGSRVGRGIYLASEAAKSEMYCRTAKVGKQNHGLLFLCEAPLGKPKYITRDDWTLTAAPRGYDSVIARGSREPDKRHDTTLRLGTHDVQVAQASVVSTGVSSSFRESEYLVYDESQCRIRFVARCQF